VFEHSTFASNGRPSGRRGWTALLSFGLQALALGIAVLVPLLYTDALPLGALKPTFMVTAPVRPAPPAPEVRHVQPTPSNFEHAQLVQPIRIPTSTHRIVDTISASTTNDYVGPEIPGVIASPSSNDAISRLLSVAPVVRPSIRPSSVRLSGGVTDGLLVWKVTPTYPTLAKNAGVQGPVVLQAIISREGVIENLQVLSGHPLLRGAAIDAVKQWRYRPYLLDHQPVEVETQITVNFHLGG
jgi:protein TonB